MNNKIKCNLFIKYDIFSTIIIISHKIFNVDLNAFLNDHFL